MINTLIKIYKVIRHPNSVVFTQPNVFALCGHQPISLTISNAQCGSLFIKGAISIDRVYPDGPIINLGSPEKEKEG